MVSFGTKVCVFLAYCAVLAINGVTSNSYYTNGKRVYEYYPIGSDINPSKNVKVVPNRRPDNGEEVFSIPNSPTTDDGLVSNINYDNEERVFIPPNTNLVPTNIVEIGSKLNLKGDEVFSPGSSTIVKTEPKFYKNNRKLVFAPFETDLRLRNFGDINKEHSTDAIDVFTLEEKPSNSETIKSRETRNYGRRETSHWYPCPSEMNLPFIYYH